uniref:AlNc14C246G9567 protein n=1 Tax=Albugo laibachii Nc14 TaxID=890382 RepID=F0WT82_9STRA|nr:AlNc14C246G9567 [Albugo laibachii Nc14]|eukprot:CCA24570.1 AlNc14C246G9567 [Albugo laibachii Nc14]
MRAAGDIYDVQDVFQQDLRNWKLVQLGPYVADSLPYQDTDREIERGRRAFQALVKVIERLLQFHVPICVRHLPFHWVLSWKLNMFDFCLHIQKEIRYKW